MSSSTHVSALSAPVASAGLVIDNSPAPIPGAVWHEAAVAGETLTYGFDRGALAGARWLTADFYTPRRGDLALVVELHEPDNPTPFICRFTLLPHAQARLRLDLDAVNLNRWCYPREGACLKPTVSGGRVDLRDVHRLVLKVLYKGPELARWCMTPLRATVEQPEALTRPLLPDGPLLDELGQATWMDWAGKTPDAATATNRIRSQWEHRAEVTVLAGRSTWGGWAERRVEATGFFRTHHDGTRWWLVDPDGCLFWSTGPSCVRPEIETYVGGLADAVAWMPPAAGDFAACHRGQDLAGVEGSLSDHRVDFLVANLIRTFGPADWCRRWEELVIPLLRGIGFNTVGNWSDCDAAGRARMPYVLSMPPSPTEKRVARVFRDFPDVFDPAYESEAAAFAEALAPRSGDPAMIGYFLMNEPLWAFTDFLLAEAMLWTAPACATCRAFADFLLKLHGDEPGLRAAWGMPLTLAQIVGESPWTLRLTEAARRDAEVFSVVMARRLYQTLGQACRRVAPRHLNLGARFSSAPKPWVAKAMAGCFDVFSINCYKTEADPRMEQVSADLGVPVLIGEWHFGALDAGLPAPGIGHVATQRDRGRAYRCYLEQSAARPWCVGAHWFTLYDQSAMGRYDGENYNIGFVDVCHRVYEPLADAARLSHAQLYDIATGRIAPCDDMPEIVERLNM